MMAEPRTAVRHIFRVVSVTTPSAGLKWLTVSPLAFATLLFFVLSAPANGQATPKPPGQLCIEEIGNCDSPVTGTTASKKWNPGHYLKPQGNHAQADQERYYSSITGQLAKLSDSPEVQGALIGYAWGAIEPSLGNYNWAPIYTHLNYLSSRGKKLILSVLIKCFGTDCTYLAPSDLASEVFITPRNSPTSIIEIWEDRNMDAFIAFWHALAAEFDGNPALEMVMGAESVPTLQGTTPPNYTKDIYSAQLKRMYTAQGTAFKNTNVIATINWLGGEVSGLIEHAYQSGVGRALPDVFDSAGSFVFRGDCYKDDCGVRDYRGLIPHFGVVSTPTLTGKHGAATDNPTDIIAYGMENGFTHYSWVSNEGGEDSWANILNAVNAAAPNANVACPKAYTQGCN